MRGDLPMIWGGRGNWKRHSFALTPTSSAAVERVKGKSIKLEFSFSKGMTVQFFEDAFCVISNSNLSRSPVSERN